MEGKYNDGTSALDGEDPEQHGVWSLTGEQADRLKEKRLVSHVEGEELVVAPFVIVLKKPLGLQLYGNEIVTILPEGGGQDWNRTAIPAEMIRSGAKIIAVLHDGDWVDTSTYAYAPLAQLLTSLPEPLQIRIAPDEHDA